MSVQPPTDTWANFRAWAIDAGERAARTFIQTFCATLVLTPVMSLTALKAAALAGIAAALSLLTSVAAPVVTSANSASYLAVPIKTVQQWAASLGFVKPSDMLLTSSALAPAQATATAGASGSVSWITAEGGSCKVSFGGGETTDGSPGVQVPATSTPPAPPLPPIGPFMRDPVPDVGHQALRARLAS